MRTAWSGARLYGLVEAYAALGDHWTGTTVDDATRAWFSGELGDLGADVDDVPYSFPRYDASCQVQVDGREVPSTPLFYSGLGDVDARRPAVTDLEFVGGYLPGDVDRLVADAAAAGHDAVLVATHGPGGRLVALNRSVDDHTPIPAALVAGAEAAALRQGSISANLAARLIEGRSSTVIGRMGPTAKSDAPVVVTTPLTGWFACAGERGSGIALALAVAATLAETVPVVVVGTTGHELEHLGGRDFLARRPDVAEGARAVVHFGAGVGVVASDSDGSPAPGFRLAMTTAPEADHAVLQASLGPAGFTVTAGPAMWPGEGGDWKRFGVPVLSLVTAFERFHTRDDVPPAATSPDVLATTLDALVAGTLLITSHSSQKEGSA